MKPVNLKQLAKDLNLSVSTVSRALSDSYQISEETKKRVFELAQKLDYQPNLYAKSLRSKSSKTIAVIIPEIANNFFTLAINGIETVADEKGYHVLIYLTHENNAKEAAYCKHLLNGRVDGVLMSMSGEVNDTSHIEGLMEHQIPVVFFDRIFEAGDTVKVTTNDRESSFLATEHLILKGCQRVAFAGISKTHSIGKKRFEGFLDALSKYQIVRKAGDIIEWSNNYQSNYQNIKNLFNNPDRPDGIFASIEEPALVCYEVCRELKLNIPADVKIVGFSNLRTATVLNPPLTTVTQPAFNIGMEAAKALFGALAKNPVPLSDQKITLPSVLIERESSF